VNLFSKLSISLLLFFTWVIFYAPKTLAQTGASSGGTGDILVENWNNTFLYNSKLQPTRLYDEFDSAPAGEIKFWTRSLSIDGCFSQSKIVDGTCATKDPSKDQSYYGPLVNNKGVGIDIVDHEGRKVNRYWIQQDTGHSHGSRLNARYDFLANYPNRRIYARYYMKFPKLLPVATSGGSWMSIGVEMKAHGWNTNATIQHNYDRSHQGWIGSRFIPVTFTPFRFQENRWYRMDVIWDMLPTGGKWEAFIDGAKWGEGTGQLAQSNGYGLWIFNLYGDMFQNQIRGEMYLGDVILSTKPIDNTALATPSPTPTPVPVDNGNYSKLIPVSVTATSSQTGYGPENTIDGDLNTRWSACGIGETIIYDLGAVKTVSHTNIAFYLASTQVALFDIEVSTDNASWTKVISGQSLTNTLGLQKFDFPDTSARYVRIVGKGNLTTDASCWNSYTEVESYGLSNNVPSQSPTPSATPVQSTTPTATAVSIASTSSWYSTFDSSTAITSPLVGSSGRLSGATLTTGKVGNGIAITSSGQYVAIPSSGSFNKAKGTLEFWIKPNWSHNDGVPHGIFSDNVGAIHLIKETNNNLRFYVSQGTTYPDVKVSAANYSFTAGTWYKIKLQWDDQASKSEQLKIFINGTEPAHTDGTDDLDSTKYNFGSEMILGSAGANNANAVIDEVRVSNSVAAWKTGDANEDGVVNGKDYVKWLNNYNVSVATRHFGGDFNEDGVVNGKDYVSWLNNFEK
jgi:hypothetical protein